MKSLCFSAGKISGAVWALLSTITLVSAAVYALGPQGSSAVWSGTLVILLAFFKARLVLFYFMEVREAPTILKHVSDSWLLFFALLALATYMGVFG